MSDAVRQRYAIATGKGPTSAPAKSNQPGFARGGSVGKSTGGALYRKGGATKKK